MAIHRFLAMTGAEINKYAALSPKIAWMACHFSTSDEGLSDFPVSLPAGSMIIVNDRLPWNGHDPDLIAQQLDSLIRRTRAGSVLLDLQRPVTPDAQALAKTLVQALPCPVAMPPLYAEGLSCPVFVPPVPPHIPYDEYLQPWNTREVWLELALDASQITLTPQGSTIRSLPFAESTEKSYQDKDLHCHYSIATEQDAVRFYLYRTEDDVAAMLNDIHLPNVTRCIGLYQELG